MHNNYYYSTFPPTHNRICSDWCMFIVNVFFSVNLDSLLTIYDQYINFVYNLHWLMIYDQYINFVYNLHFHLKLYTFPFDLTLSCFLRNKPQLKKFTGTWTWLVTQSNPVKSTYQPSSSPLTFKDCCLLFIWLYIRLIKGKTYGTIKKQLTVCS